MSQFNIELFGAPGAGKTLIAASLYAHLMQKKEHYKKLSASGGVNSQAERLMRRQNLEPSGADEEYLIVQLDDETNIKITAHKGESLVAPQSELNTSDLIERFEKACDRRFVAVLNPFMCNYALAWIATQSMISTLQDAVNRNFVDATTIALGSLFHLEKIDEDAPGLKELFARAQTKSIKISFDYREPRQELRFKWDGSDAVVKMAEKELKRYTRQVVDLTLKYRAAARDVLHAAPNGMVILTHIDLEQLMPAIDRSDFDAIFDDLFENRPDRLVSQQFLAAMIKSNVSERGIEIWDRMDQFPERFFGYVLATAKKASREVGATVTKAPAPNNSRPKGALFKITAIAALIVNLLLAVLASNTWVPWISSISVAVVSLVGWLAIRKVDQGVS